MTARKAEHSHAVTEEFVAHKGSALLRVIDTLK
jgi:hypothetical protein